jgi:DNA topoisomerase-3
VVLGQNDFRAVIDGIAKSAAELISNLQQQANVKVDLAPAVRHTGSGRSRRLPPGAVSPARKRRPGPVRPRGSQGPQTEAAVSPPLEQAGLEEWQSHLEQGNVRKPTPRMIAFARAIAKKKSVDLPRGCDLNFDTCRAFLQQHASDNGSRFGKRGP